MLKETRKSCNVTQEELAERTGTKKSYISRIETGKSEIQLSTFFKLVEKGLGRTITINIA
ncbi:MAG TPA: helix-turn-helix transcriptional regulator [Saprospiraceae bacterium]|jgi:transcriptional regulator with XRE-family HTH domain|nr:helix-turn-helix transcriptional regulator [Saprospiraceae bacterium]HMT70496.1 helix-turn-helix transcriptional regulator [Saprospiraceae bacterium]